MKIGRRSLLWYVAALMAGALFGSSCDRVESWLQPDRCALSGRPIRPGMGAVIRVEGREKPLRGCCLRCTINFARQTGKRIRILSVTDYESRKQISAGTAFYLSGSALTPCAGPRIDTPATRRESAMQAWDRCLPSVIAFADRKAALRFQSEEGGTIRTFSELVEGTDLVTAE